MCIPNLAALTPKCDYHSLRPYIQRRGIAPETTSDIMHPEIDEQSIHNFQEDNNCRLIVRPMDKLDPISIHLTRIQTISHAEADLYNLFSVSDLSSLIIQVLLLIG